MDYSEVCILISKCLEAFYFSFSFLYNLKLRLWTQWNKMRLCLFSYFIEVLQISLEGSFQILVLHSSSQSFALVTIREFPKNM